MDLIRWLFEGATFGWDIINSFGFGECGFDELLHGVFTFLHVGMSDSHFFGNGLSCFFIHLRGSRSRKIAILSANGMAIFRKGVGSERRGWDFPFVGWGLLILIIMFLKQIEVLKLLIGTIHLPMSICLLSALIIKELTGQLLKLIIKISDLLDILIRSAIWDTQLSKILYRLPLLNLQRYILQQINQWLYLICILITMMGLTLCTYRVL